MSNLHGNANPSQTMRGKQCGFNKTVFSEIFRIHALLCCVSGFCFRRVEEGIGSWERVLAVSG